MVNVILAPYLRVGNQPLHVGPWEAIPAGQLERAQTPSDLAFEQSRGPLELYQRSRRVRDGFDLFFRRGRRLVGENFTVKDLATLRHVLLVALLDRNPSDDFGALVWRGTTRTEPRCADATLSLKKSNSTVGSS